MFGVDWQEFLIIGIVALVVIGPKDLPRAMRVVGQWVGKARATARHFRSGIDTMIREAELEEMNNRWAEQNKAIMSDNPMPDLSFADTSAVAIDEPAMAPPVAKPRARRKRVAATQPETGSDR